jgi:ABC-type transport system substrate-binding protein
MMANNVGQTDDLDAALKQAVGATDDAAVLALVEGGTAADTITRTTGSFVEDGYVAGERLEIDGSAADDGIYLIDTVAALTITLDAGADLEGEAASADIDIESVGAAADAMVKLTDKTFTLELEQYKATFIRDITDAVITPEHIWSEVDDVMTYLNPEPIGSGPFELVSRTVDESVIYDARLDYWGGMPNIDRYIKHFFGEEQVQMLALMNGDIDSALQLNMPTAIPTLLTNDDIKIYQADTNSTYSWYLNHRIEPFGELAVRKAMSIGIDRAAMVNFASDGWAVMPNLIEVSPLLAHSNPAVLWPYADNTHAERIDMANDALDAIDGISDFVADTIRTHDGTPMEYQVLTTTSPQHTSIFELLESDLLEMGIKLHHDPQEAKALVGTVFRQKSATAGETADDWDSAVWGRPFGPLYDYVADQWGEHDPPTWSKRGTIMGWEPANDVWDEFAELQTYPVGDPTRVALIQSSQVLWAAEEPSIALFHSVTPHAYRTDRFTGFIEDAGLQVNGAMGAMGATYTLLNLVPIYD